jgi:hypothetical protein
MSSQSFALNDGSSLLADPAAQPARPAGGSRIKRLARILCGCCLMALGAWKVYNGLMVLTGATSPCTVLKVNNSNLYYTRDISAAEAKALADYLVTAKLVDGGSFSVQLTREGRTVQVRFPVNPGSEKDPACIGLGRQLGTRLARDVFAGSPVEIDLCDENWKTLYAFPATLAK